MELKLSVVSLSSVIKCSPQKWKNNHQKDASHLKNKITHIARDKRRTLEREKNEKRKVWEKVNNVTTTIKFFAFIFCIWKRIDFTRRHNLGKCSLNYYISSKVFFSVAGYLKRSHETPTSK